MTQVPNMHTYQILDEKSQNKFIHLFKSIYKDESVEKLYPFLHDMKLTKMDVDRNLPPIENPDFWYKNIVMYALYVDLFSENFQGLEKKLDYLSDLGVTCIWVLPILDSPMRDQGFDVRNYFRIRKNLLNLPEDASDEEWYAKQMEVFSNFRKKAHEKGIKILIDCPFNHTSEEHAWFQNAKKDAKSKYRNYYIWSSDDKKYSKVRIIFDDTETSNWEKCGHEFYYHRFYSHQPDLNYKNPDVLFDIGRVLMSWIVQGVDGFRGDAIAMLWKEEGTTCENLPQTHMILKFYRAMLDYIRPGTILLAESCQEPKDVVQYFGNEDECHAAYHFPLMPQIYNAIYKENKQPIEMIMDPSVTPPIPPSCQWFVFLRCHDELTLEMCPKEDQQNLFNHFCKNKEWSFRDGKGISARLRNLLETPELISLANSILLTIYGTPILYYGDEFGMENDLEFYKEMSNLTKINDTRYLCRGRVNWTKVEKELSDPSSIGYKIYNNLKKKLQIRKQFSCLGDGKITFLEVKNLNGTPEQHILGYIRSNEKDAFLAFHNLSSKLNIEFVLPNLALKIESRDLLGQPVRYNEKNNSIIMEKHSYLWLRMQPGVLINE